MTNTSEKYFIIGTAGHVDHGKTELIRALTGTNTDRLAEEQVRGISIDLGFASFPLSKTINAGIIDVPGHERFVSNMLAGVGGIDLVLFVVDSGEGVMPQTMEHLRILQLLDIKQGIIILTKSDLHDREWIEVVQEEVLDAFKGSFLENAPVIAVSSITGAGIDQLKTEILNKADQLQMKSSDGVLRMPVDRSFSIQGFGTVVTGTLISGRVAVGDTIELVPTGKTTRVREIEIHGDTCDQAVAGQRAALNLVGIEKSEVKRGVVVASPQFFSATERVDVKLTLLDDAQLSVKMGQDVHVFLGTGKFRARVAPLDRDLIDAGDSVFAQLHFYAPVTAFRGDRFVVRSCSPAFTIGGGVIIDALAPKHRRFRSEVIDMLSGLESGELGYLIGKLQSLKAATVKRLVAETSLNQVQLRTHLAELQSQGSIIDMADNWLTKENFSLLVNESAKLLERYHHEHHLNPGVPHATLKAQIDWPLSGKGFNALVAYLVDQKIAVVCSDHIALPEFQPDPSPEEAVIIAKISQLYLNAGFQVKNRREMMVQLNIHLDEHVEESFFSYLVYKEELVRLNDESSIHRSWYKKAIDILLNCFSQADDLSLAQYRDQLGSGRKLTQALLEFFDTKRYTMRRDDVRIARSLPTLVANTDNNKDTNETIDGTLS